MKITKTTSLKVFLPAALAALAITILWGVSVRPAHAGYIVTLQQVGSDVVATGSGSIDLTGLSFLQTLPISTGISPFTAFIETGSDSVSVNQYTGVTGPTNFGSGMEHFPSSDSGDLVGVDGKNGFLFVPIGYTSGTGLTNSATYSGQTFSSLRVQAGTYVWSWGTGMNQNFTLQIPATAVPDTDSSFGSLLLSLAALFGVSRFRSPRLAKPSGGSNPPPPKSEGLRVPISNTCYVSHKMS
jgi:hypothetical protein